MQACWRNLFISHGGLYGSFVMTQVTDDDGQPLSTVLLSLSAGQFRSNNLTLDNGTMIFPNLVSRCC